VSALIKQHRLPPELVHLVLVNGVYQDSAVRDEVCLQDGDALAIWPPVAGG
jgi:molybdopterin converting factor small subunit